MKILDKDGLTHLVTGIKSLVNEKLDKSYENLPANRSKMLSTDTTGNIVLADLPTDASKLSSGTLPTARLPSDVLKNTAQTFTEAQQNQVKTNLDILKTWVGLEVDKGEDENTIYYCHE